MKKYCKGETKNKGHVGENGAKDKLRQKCVIGWEWLEKVMKN